MTLSPHGNSIARKPSEAATLWDHLKGFWSGAKSALKCRPFVKLCLASFLVFNGYQFGNFFSLYVMQYYLFHGNDTSAGELNGQYGTITSICTFGVIPLAVWFAAKIGKRRAFFVTISLSLVGYALKWIGYNPDHPQLLLAACPFIAFGMGSLFTLMGSMLADVCDYDELENGKRREGFFGAIYWWTVKLGMALAGLLSGLALEYSGFDVKLAGSQTAYTLLLLRLFDVVVPLVTSAIAIGFVAAYQITEARAGQISNELEQRQKELRASP